MRIYTIGHGRLAADRIAEFLGPLGVRVVVDVRSVPFSRANPEANQIHLARVLRGAGIAYRWMGDRLGGKPRGRIGRLDIAGRFEDPRFWEAIEELLRLAKTAPIALLCAEEDPRRCHRRFLVTRALLERGIAAEAVHHLRHDGRVETEAELQAEEAPLFRGELPDP